MAKLRVEWRDWSEFQGSQAVPGPDPERPSRYWDREPARFGWGDRMQGVVEVLDRWPGEGHGYFRIRAEDGAIYILRHDEPSDEWQLVFFLDDDDDGERPPGSTSSA